MELQLNSKQFEFLNEVVREVGNQELTQELRLSDGMPDIKRVIGSWGQCVIRSKEWHTDYISCSGGMMVWVLYEPEGEEPLQVMDAWIPFQQRWELPKDTREGDIRITCLTRFVDARSVSPRKMMLRTGAAVSAEAFTRESAMVKVPEAGQSEAQLLINQYPVLLRKEAGEKTFLQDEELSLPESIPAAKKLIYCTLDPVLQEKRVVADKLAFRGSGKLHVLYMSETGQVHSWDFEIELSQFAQLENAYGKDAQADIRTAVTSMEPELTESGKLRLKCALVSQYVIWDQENIEVLEDAFCPFRELQLEQEIFSLPVMLEKSRDTISAEQKINAEANLIPDARFLPDYPLQHRNGQYVELDFPGSFQILYYDRNSQLQMTSSRWEGHESVPCHGDASLAVIPQYPQVQAAAANESMDVKMELPFVQTAFARQQIPMITQVTLGKEISADPDRPSLILQRCAGETLWQMAKHNHSTVDAIRKANGLEGECGPGQLLLIPVL